MTVAAQEREQDKVRDDIIVSGSTWAAIWHMSWPLLLNMLTIAVASFVDVWVAGKLGSETQAAIGICGQIWYFLVMLAVALSAGTTALVSRAWGAREYDKAVEAARHSVLFAAVFGVVSCVLGLLACCPLLQSLGASQAVQDLGWRYLQFDMLSQIPFTLLWVVNSIFRAKGNARVPMIIWGMMTVLIITLDFALCLGPFHLGIAGIGISWLIAATIGIAVELFLLKYSELGECLDFLGTLRDVALSLQWFKRIISIGVPACVQDLAWVAGNFALFIIFAQTHNPTACQASWAVGLRLEEMVAGMPIYALAMAVATIVGQNLGANQPERAEKAGWQVATIGGVYNGIMGLLLCVAALPIAQTMSTDGIVIDYTVQYLRIVGLSQAFVAIWLILFGAMQGAGYTKWPMWASTICLTVVRLPLAWYLTVPLHMEPTGIWLGVALSSTAIGCLAIWRFKSGVWKTQKV